MKYEEDLTQFSLKDKNVKPTYIENLLDGKTLDQAYALEASRTGIKKIDLTNKFGKGGRDKQFAKIIERLELWNLHRTKKIGSVAFNELMDEILPVALGAYSKHSDKTAKELELMFSHLTKHQQLNSIFKALKALK